MNTGISVLKFNGQRLGTVESLEELREMLEGIQLEPTSLFLTDSPRITCDLCCGDRVAIRGTGHYPHSETPMAITTAVINPEDDSRESEWVIMVIPMRLLAETKPRAAAVERRERQFGFTATHAAM